MDVLSSETGPQNEMVSRQMIQSICLPCKTGLVFSIDGKNLLHARLFRGNSFCVFTTPTQMSDVQLCAF